MAGTIGAHHLDDSDHSPGVMGLGTIQCVTRHSGRLQSVEVVEFNYSADGTFGGVTNHQSLETYSIIRACSTTQTIKYQISDNDCRALSVHPPMKPPSFRPKEAGHSNSQGRRSSGSPGLLIKRNPKSPEGASNQLFSFIASIRRSCMRSRFNDRPFRPSCGFNAPDQGLRRTSDPGYGYGWPFGPEDLHLFPSAMA